MYDEHAERYAELVRQGELRPIVRGLAARLLDIAGDVSGLKVLDAGCGEGHLSLDLAARGARVVGIDVSPRLIALARSAAAAVGGDLVFEVGDLTEPSRWQTQEFDLALSNLVFDDVGDHRSFATALAGAVRTGGRQVLSGNNPYSAVLREKVASYFDSGASSMYAGLAALGIEARYHHRTLEETLSAFRESGFALRRLFDVRRPGDGTDREPGHRALRERFPWFMILEFERGQA